MLTNLPRIRRLAATAGILLISLPMISSDSLGVHFVDVAAEVGLRHKTIFGDEKRNRYLLETTGCGAAFFDYDADGWPDIFLVNGTRLEANFDAGSEPTNRLFRNQRDGTFADVTETSGLQRTGWGQGVCVGDYNNDGHDDLFVTYWGENALYRNNADGTFTDVARQAGVSTGGGALRRWNTGCAFVDYDKDSFLDLFVANYIDFDPETAPLPETGPCRYKGILVACGPPGLPGGKNILFRNNGDGTFSDVSKKAGILDTPGTYGLGVLVADFDNDSWPDIYVANDSSSSALYRNSGDGNFSEIGIEAGVAYGPDGNSQAGMGVTAGDYDGDGFLDIAKTNFAGDTSSLYRNLGDGYFEDRTFQAGLGRNTRFLGWGIGFFDFDNDGWLDLLTTNGHVYPEVGDSGAEAGYRQRKVLLRNLGDGAFEDVSLRAGPGITASVPGRGTAFGDFDNDGDLDILVNTVNDSPQLLRCETTRIGRWLSVKAVGVKSNRSAIGTRIYCITSGGRKQIGEVRSGGSYISQNDLRVHFGLGQADKANLEIHWPSGHVDRLADVDAGQFLTVIEGKGSR